MFIRGLSGVVLHIYFPPLTLLCFDSGYVIIRQHICFYWGTEGNVP